MTVLQHPAEHRHALGSMRFVQLGLSRVRQVVHWNLRRAPPPALGLPPDSVLLFPSDVATDLTEVARQNRPGHLLALDGTWAQARTLIAAHPGLATLPHARVRSSRPSRYGRLRQEPRAECLSTLEAVVEALRLLEPDLDGLDELLAAFEQMVATQLACGDDKRPRFKRRLPRVAQPVPRVLVVRPHQVVVACCEAMASDPGREELVHLVAQRLDGSGPRAWMIRPARGWPTAEHVAQMRLRSEQLAAGVTEDVAARMLADTLGSTGVLAAWNQRVVTLLARLLGPRPSIMLKGVYCNARGGPCGHLAEVVARERLRAAPSIPTRAGERLAQAVAVAQMLGRTAAPSQGHADLRGASTASTAKGPR